MEDRLPCHRRRAIGQIGREAKPVRVGLFGSAGTAVTDDAATDVKEILWGDDT